MPLDSYRLLYSAPLSPPLGFWAIGALGIGLVLLGRRWWRSLSATNAQDLIAAMIPPSMLMFAGAATALIMLVAPLASYTVFSVRLLTGHVTVVEGVIEDFTRGDDHRDESWSLVSGNHRSTYSYNPYRSFGGYDRPTPEGGPLHDGVRVRVAEVAGRIVRLEVADSTR